MKSIATSQPPAESPVTDAWRPFLLLPRAILLIGTAEQTSPLIASLLPSSPAPVEICRASNFMPDNAVRTVVLQDPGEMTPARQAALLAWMNEMGEDGRVIATAREPLFPSVESGRFSDSLYYRLNMIVVDFSDAWRW